MPETSETAAGAEPLRFYDAHVHFWDPALVVDYPQLAPDYRFRSIDLGAATQMKRKYTPERLRAEAAPIEIVGAVHVSATRGARAYLDETRRMSRLQEATGLPTALVGSFDPDARLAEIEADIDEQLQAPAFVGVRTVPGLDYASARAGDVMGLVAERGLVYDAVAHPAELPGLARRLAASPSVLCVLEHTGWPLSGDDAVHGRQWQDGMQAVAGAGPDVYCKLSGLAMTLHTLDVDTLRPWLEFAIETFGVERCLFGSNFPVDGVFGDLAALLRAYRTVTDGLGSAAQTALFATNAPAIYSRRQV